MPPGHHFLEVFRAHPTGKWSWGRPKRCWRDYIYHLTWKCFGIPQEELENISEWKVWTSLLILLPPDEPQIRCTLWMDDWMDECYSLGIPSNTTCWLCMGCIPKDWKGLLVTGLWPARGQPSQHDSYQIDSLIRMTFWEFWNTDGIKNGWCLCSLPQILLDS